MWLCGSVQVFPVSRNDKGKILTDSMKKKTVWRHCCTRAYTKFRQWLQANRCACLWHQILIREQVERQRRRQEGRWLRGAKEMRQWRVNVGSEGASGDKRVEGRQWLLIIKPMYAQIGTHQLGCERRVRPCVHRFLNQRAPALQCSKRRRRNIRLTQCLLRKTEVQGQIRYRI